MNKLIKTVLATVVLAALVLTPSLSAQQTLTQTTLSSAATATADRIVVSSATGFTVGNTVVIDREAFFISAISSTTISVFRGTLGTVAEAHASGAVVYTGPNNYFLAKDPAPGGCTATNFVALPAVVIPSGSVFDCKASSLVRYRDRGVISPSVGAAQTYTTSGAITVMPGLHLIGSGGALTMTLAAPTSAQDGIVLDISLITAQAHTVGVTAGFNGGGAGVDLCTFTAAIGNQITVRASGGNWYIVSARNCTLS